MLQGAANAAVNKNLPAANKEKERREEVPEPGPPARPPLLARYPTLPQGCGSVSGRIFCLLLPKNITGSYPSFVKLL